ncbi:unnamed protein product [Tuber aestivum]|uniref:Uncharacterized protein n=1 Tax=Tuber aestivum TaxID=59557 RepID=A0A292PN87_9PEZI|nr:unnamed protein product [Tuber aestivum]
MARTDSGKTVSFVVPMVVRLKTHSRRMGALAQLPGGGLVLQTMKVVKGFKGRTVSGRE